MFSFSTGHFPFLFIRDTWAPRAKQATSGARYVGMRTRKQIRLVTLSDLELKVLFLLLGFPSTVESVDYRRTDAIYVDEQVPQPVSDRSASFVGSADQLWIAGHGWNSGRTMLELGDASLFVMGGARMRQWPEEGLASDTGWLRRQIGGWHEKAGLVERERVTLSASTSVPGGVLFLACSSPWVWVRGTPGGDRRGSEDHKEETGQPKMSVICRAKGVTRRGTMPESRCTCEKPPNRGEKLEGSPILESAHQCGTKYY